MPDKGAWPPAGDREFEFLRLALAYRLFRERPFPNPPADLDWERLFTLLRHHRLSAHFYVLGKSKRKKWPSSFLEGLRLDYYGLIIYSDQFVSLIKPVLSALKEANIPVIVLKGWALIQTIYGGDHGQRVYDDIDLLVHPKDTDAANTILNKLSWRIEEEQRPGYIRRYFNAQPYFFMQPEFPGRVYSIGFHWGLLHHPAYNPEQIEIGPLFRRAHPLEIAEIPVLEMSIEDHIAYNCAHIVLQHHSRESLLRYYEIALMIRDANSNLDWQKVEETARSWKLVIPLKKVVEKVEKLWPGTLPSSAINSIEQIKPALSEQFIDFWYKRTKFNPILEHLLIWLTMTGMRRRLSFIWEDVFPNPAYLEKEYGAVAGNLWPLLYFRRIIRVFGYLRK